LDADPGALEISAENELFTTFLRQYWSSLYMPRERELYAAIKQRVTTEPQAVEFVNTVSAATIYAALLNSDHDYWDSLGATAKENLETLIRLDLDSIGHFFSQHCNIHRWRKKASPIHSRLVSPRPYCGRIGGGIMKDYCQAAGRSER
jgi:hypothetical protein